MADITASQITGKMHFTIGGARMWVAKVQGDGSGTTIPVPFSRVFSVATANIDDTSAVPGVSFASGVLTYAAAPTSTKYHYITIIGI